MTTDGGRLARQRAAGHRRGHATRHVHVGRQPLYDRAGAVVGYELLFRGEADAVAASAKGAYATSQVLVNTFTEFGVEHLVSDRLGFVNVTREFLVGELPLPFEPGPAVLEVLESVAVDDEVVAGCAALAERGYAIALDDFVFSNSTARLLDLASYVKIDMMGVSPVVLTAVVTTCRLYPRLKLVAERVDTERELALAHKLGFDLFQGYALARPQVLSTVALEPSRLTTLRLLAMVNDPDAELDDVAAQVSADPALTVRVLRAANSASSAVNRRVESVRDAAVLIGMTQLRQWLTLMAVSDLAGGEDRVGSILVRARFCERIADWLGTGVPAAFTAGLLDAVCDLYGQPRPTLVPSLPLSAELRAALMDGTGPLGGVLKLARSYETNGPIDTPMPAADLAYAYLESVRWAEQVLTRNPEK